MKDNCVIDTWRWASGAGTFYEQGGGKCKLRFAKKRPIIRIK